MRRHIWIGAFLIPLLAWGRGLAGEPQCCEPPEACWLKRWHPVGGWHPYGCTLHWWPQHCFPRVGAPDDYDRKPLPRVCWPAYPPYYILFPPESCYPEVKCETVSK